MNSVIINNGKCCNSVSFFAGKWQPHCLERRYLSVSINNEFAIRGALLILAIELAMVVSVTLERHGAYSFAEKTWTLQ
jgi:hypothetical protein